MSITLATKKAELINNSIRANFVC